MCRCGPSSMADQPCPRATLKASRWSTSPTRLLERDRSLAWCQGSPTRQGRSAKSARTCTRHRKQDQWRVFLNRSPEQLSAQRTPRNAVNASHPFTSSRVLTVNVGIQDVDASRDHGLVAAAHQAQSQRIAWGTSTASEGSNDETPNGTQPPSSLQRTSARNSRANDGPTARPQRLSD